MPNSRKIKVIDRVTKVAKTVVTGKEKDIWGRYHKLSCERHLKDLDRQKDKTFPYRWDPAKAEDLLEFAETLTIAEGEAPIPVKLDGWQIFDLGCRWGWVYKDRYFDDKRKKWIRPDRAGKRRFRRSYISVARQNGKTFINGINGTYIAGFGNYQYGKLFTAATKQKQARLAWEEIKKFIQIDDDLNEFFEIKDYINTITCPSTDCTIEALSRDSALDEGFRGIYISLDEVHQHKDNGIYKSLYNGTKSLPETLLSMITTRGNRLNSFCKEIDDYCIKVLEGLTTADDFFVDIYCLDKGDDYFDESKWIKANPRLAATESGMESLRSDAATAKEMGGSELRDFIIKSLNMWSIYMENIFIDVDKWKKCACKLTMEDMRGKSCYVGLDLSSGGDLTTSALEFEIDDGLFYHSTSYMPRGRLEEHIETDTAPYDIWESMGLINVTGGLNDFKNDYAFIIKDLHDIQEKYNLTFLGIGIDPHNADAIMSLLEEFGCPILMVQQSAKFLNDATEDMQLNIKSEKVRYNEKEELLTWSFTNAKVVKNSFGEIKVDKEPRSLTKRIDPVDACIDAHAMRLKNKDEVKPDVNEIMQKYLEMMKGK